MAHVSEESRFQTITFFCPLFGFDQALFGFFQFGDIIIDTDHVQLLGIIVHCVTDYIDPRPFVAFGSGDSQVFEKAFDYSGFHLLDGLQDIIPVFRVYVFVYTDDFREGRRCFFSQIIIPLRDPIAGTCPDVESTISDFADHRERTFEFCQLAIYLCDFGIVDID